MRVQFFYLFPFQEKWAPMKVSAIINFELLTSIQTWKFNCTLDAAVRRTFIKYSQFVNTILLNIPITPISNSSI